MTTTTTGGGGGGGNSIWSKGLVVVTCLLYFWMCVFSPFETETLSPPPPPPPAALRTTSEQGTRRLQSMKEDEKLRSLLDKRALERRKRTTPKIQSLAFIPPHYSGVSVENVNEAAMNTNDDESDTTEEKDEKEESISHSICGTASSIQNAFAKYPHHYPIQHSLAPSSSSSSVAVVVAIVGLLSNPLGVELALMLHKQCHVDKIIGIDDSILPIDSGAASSRIQFLDERLALLQKEIPTLELVKPAHVGIQPRERLDFVSSSSSSSSRSNNRSRVLDSSWVNGTTGDDVKEEEWDLMKLYQPSHVVHLGSYRGDVVVEKEEEVNFWELRQSMVSMEQILRSIRMDAMEKKKKKGGKEQVHFVYASSDSVYGFRNEASQREREREREREQEQEQEQASNRRRRLNEAPAIHNKDPPQSTTSTTSNARNIAVSIHGASKVMDEVLASTYHSLYGIHSVGLRFSSVYGPSYGRRIKSSNISNMAKRAVTNPDSTILSSVEMEKGKMDVDFVFVADAVSAIVAAMQFVNHDDHRNDSNQLLSSFFNVGSGHTSTLSDVSEQMQQYYPRSNQSQQQTKSNLKQALVAVVDRVHDDTAKNVLREVWQPNIDMESTAQLLGYTPSTSLADGIRSTLAWHFNVAFPFGYQQPHHHPPQGATNAISPNHSAITTTPIPNVFPCASECSVSNRCTPSPYDPVLNLLQQITTTCTHVLYTADLTTNLLKLPYGSRPSSNPKSESAICKIAFVSTHSPFLKKLYKQSNQIDTNHDPNGRISYKHWTIVHLLIPTDAAHSRTTTAPTTTTTHWENLAKINPGKLFSNPNIQTATYLSSHHNNIPSTTELLNTIRRQTFATHEPEYKTYIGENPYKKTIRVPAKPARRSIMTFHEYTLGKHDNTLDIPSGWIKVTQMIPLLYPKVVVREGDDDAVKNHPQLRYYDTILPILRNPEFSPNPTTTSTTQNHNRTPPMRWISTQQLLIHEMTNDESRFLRCDWYREYHFWNHPPQPPSSRNNGILPPMEDISLSYTLLKRRITHKHERRCHDWGKEWIPVMQSPTTSSGSSTTEQNKDDVATTTPYSDPSMIQAEKEMKDKKCGSTTDPARNENGVRLFVKALEMDIGSSNRVKQAFKSWRKNNDKRKLKHRHVWTRTEEEEKHENELEVEEEENDPHYW